MENDQMQHSAPKAESAATTEQGYHEQGNAGGSRANSRNRNRSRQERNHHTGNRSNGRVDGQPEGDARASGGHDAASSTSKSHVGRNNRSAGRKSAPPTSGTTSTASADQASPAQTSAPSVSNTPATSHAVTTVSAVHRQARTVWSSSRKRPNRPTAPATLTADTKSALPTDAGSPNRGGMSANAAVHSPANAAESGIAPNANDGTTQENVRPWPQNTTEEKGLHAQAPRLPGKRPPRMPHKAHAPAELPQMDNLLIEDCPTETEGAGETSLEYRPDASELEHILQAEIYTPQSQKIPEVIPEGKVVIVGIRFRTGGKTYFFDPGKETCTIGQNAIVETARGIEFGEICISNRMVDQSLVVQPLRPILRLATPEDIAHNKENHEREAEAYRIGVEKILAHKLDMKLVTVQYTFDNSKLLFYFTSAGRVDFRDLVKDLASVFHIRIELRQIGIRDEARMIGGLGACGRPLCCHTFLSDFGQVSMKMAKEQNLSLNSSKISGCCGRLMCCLRYEYDTYVEEIRRTPAVGSFVNTPDGPGVITEIFPLIGEVKVHLRNQSDAAPKKYKREDVTPHAPVSRPGETGHPVRMPAPQPEDIGEPDEDM